MKKKSIFLTGLLGIVFLLTVAWKSRELPPQLERDPETYASFGMWVSSSVHVSLVVDGKLVYEKQVDVAAERCPDGIFLLLAAGDKPNPSTNSFKVNW